MPTGFIVFIFVFLLIFYIFTFIKIRKRRKANQKSVVAELTAKYKNINDAASKESNDAASLQIDFVDKDEFYKEIQAEVNNSKSENKKKNGRYPIKPLEF